MLAILAVALHTMLWAVMAPLSAFAATGTGDSFDPFLVICHSGGALDGADIDKAGAPRSKPTGACDHCNLCSAAATGAAPDVVVIARLLPERVIAVLSPASVPRRQGLTSSPQLARGPPQQA